MKRYSFLVFLLVLAANRQSYCQTFAELLQAAGRHWAAHNLDSALTYSRLTLAKTRILYGNDDTTYADILANYIAPISALAGKISDAVAALDTAEGIYRKAFGKEHAKIATVLHRRGTCLWDLARYEEGEKLLRQSLQMRERLLGPDHGVTQQTLVNLAALLNEEGKLSEAGILYDRLQALLDRLEIEPGDILANNMGNFFLDVGRTAEAESLFVQSVRRARRSHQNPFRMVLINLGNLYTHQGRHQEAEALLKEAVAIYDSIAEHESWDERIRANPRLHLADHYLARHRYTEAESLYAQSIQLFEQLENPDFVYAIRARRGLVTLYLSKGDFVKAESELRMIIDKTVETLGNEHPDMIVNLDLATRFHCAQRQYSKAMEIALASARLALETYANNVGTMTEHKALLFFRELQGTLSSMFSCWHDMKQLPTNHMREICEVLLRSKGLISEGAWLQHRALSETPDSTTRSVVVEYSRAKMSLAKHYALMMTKVASSNDLRLRVDSLSRCVETIEQALNKLSFPFRKETGKQNLGPEYVATLLPNKTTFIEFLKWEYLSPAHGLTVPHYLALVIKSTGQYSLKDLGPAHSIDSLIDQYRKNLQDATAKNSSNRASAKYSRISSQLYERIWAPLATFLGRDRMVLIAPDAGLNLISFGELIANGRYLIERHPVHYLSAGRDLLRFRDRDSSGVGLLALGDPDYAATVEMRSVRRVANTSGVEAIPDHYATRNVRPGCGDLSEMKAAPLPGTRIEVKEIAESWNRESGEEGALVLIASQASEEELKRNAAGRRVIHIATHGYFLHGECGSDQSKSFGSSVGENPLLLSGLLLAGANLRGNGADSANAEDGILTALEVSAMDLRGTDLVVLSACETGLGKVEQGEGVYGLRRAFQMAGAKTVVSSLWRVPDDETMKFMKALYSNMNHVERRGSSLCSYPELMQKVALERLRELRLRGRPTHPFTWGAFVATGDWRIK